MLLLLRPTLTFTGWEEVEAAAGLGSRTRGESRVKHRLNSSNVSKEPAGTVSHTELGILERGKLFTVLFPLHSDINLFRLLSKP